MDQGIAIVIGAIIGAVISGITAYFTSKANLKAVQRTANATIESQSKISLADIERTGQEIKAKIGVEVLSKNRQEWINDLRKKTAEIYYYLYDSMYLVSDNLSSDTNIPEHIEKLKFNLNEANKLHGYLLLLLNPNEDSYHKIDNLIVRGKLCINSLIIDINKNSNVIPILEKFNVICEEILSTTQSILKTEWERVKKGV